MNMISAQDILNSTGTACPTNGKIGRRVNTQTVKALLGLSLNVLRSVEYRFCPDPNCPTVYYSVDGLQTFVESDLRERIYQKHPTESGVFICYCFRHTLGDILSDPSAPILDEINLGVINGQCACDIRNPQGNCCLGNVSAAIKNNK
ncbi:MAG TPA: hypothetical protein VHM28_04595 [Anaerolineales bacterium]|jgi:hypothetical protein|nr:hypothetical protein [Anaerolineales bacterium]